MRTSLCITIAFYQDEPTVSSDCNELQRIQSTRKFSIPIPTHSYLRSFPCSEKTEKERKTSNYVEISGDCYPSSTLNNIPGEKNEHKRTSIRRYITQ